MEKEEKTKPWWQPAIIMFARVTTWVAIPIICALYLGKYLDNRYGTKPWIFLGCTIVAFIISMIAIGRISLKYIHRLEKETEEKNGKSN